MSANLNFVAGQWRPAATGRSFERRNPADTDDLIGAFPASGPADVEAAVAGLRRGAAAWAKSSPEQRMQVLERMAELMLARTDELARELTREEGKTLAESSNEVKRTAANFRLYAGEALRLRGETFPAEGGQIVMTLRRPVGIVAAITPWNFPISIPARKIGPALAAGNAVLFKPAGLTPLMGQRLVELLLEAGLPAEAIALVQGSGAEVGDAVVAGANAVTFTGSYATGCGIYAKAGPERRTQLEMGGKNPCIVLEDADPEVAATVIARGAFGLSGQACTGTSRVLAVGSIYDAVVEKVAAKAAAIAVGNGLHQGVGMGPQASEGQMNTVLGYVALGREEGARLVAGGERVTGEGCDKGWFVRPTVFADVPAGARLQREEIFGPVVGLQRVDDLDQALAMANDVEYGLAASLVTRDLGKAIDFAERIDAGVIKVNSPTTGVALTAPFGGIKHSSNQTYKEQAGHGVMDFYTTTKTVYLAG
ncbi:MAG: aldehyde dehydrogenase family protein [Alphaproteobacteria bacterium]